MMVHSLHVDNYISIVQVVTTLLAAVGTLYLGYRSWMSSRTAIRISEDSLKISEASLKNAVEDRLFDMAKLIRSNIEHSPSFNNIDDIYTKLTLFCQMVANQTTDKQSASRAFDNLWSLLSPALWSEVREGSLANERLSWLRDRLHKPDLSDDDAYRLKENIDALTGQMERVRTDFAETAERYGKKISA